jgi:hypothetical protein
MKVKTKYNIYLPDKFRAIEINNSRCKKTGKSQVDIIVEILNKEKQYYEHEITSYTDVIKNRKWNKIYYSK